MVGLEAGYREFEHRGLPRLKGTTRALSISALASLALRERTWLGTARMGPACQIVRLSTCKAL